MTYEALLATAPPHHTPAFLDFLREHNEVLYEDGQWLVIKNVKYGWPTAFAKNVLPAFTERFLELYGKFEWRKKAQEKQTVKRFHFHIISAPEVTDEV